ncbi:hypothetical protein [Maridesulfovibrio salexigens]|uniref:Transcriptional activator TraM n=1 Tax=Maridesulfovibrio salexigens (strain ATCC 14822 / DSM 2638 / NCIMB 8403 / VKM B-1763) TaxID=526222 RepID=C6BT68_MARSD|nr:hypothetical protein [Maridesulfovibrio salexigens]ACS79772.1 hypothetical protein Desal_1710 [Maridesulfovibrio salexigens DSM 2638]
MSDQTPDNAPLTIQSVRDLIAKEHNLLLDEDDPILVAVTINRAALDEYERLLQNHKQQLSKDMEEHVASFALEVRKSTNSLLSKAVKANIENCLSVINEHQGQMNNFLGSVRGLAIFAGVMFCLSIAVSLSVIVWGS